MSAKSSIRDKIRVADDRAEKLVDVPEWEVKLLLIAPTARERSTMMTRYMEPVGRDDDGNELRSLNVQKMMPSLLVSCAHDPETRERAFEDDDVDWLGDKNGAIVERIGFECMPLAGFTQPGDDGPTDTGKDDSSTTLSGDTKSGSPDSSVAP